MINKILIFGTDGMLGRYVHTYLSNIKKYELLTKSLDNNMYKNNSILYCIKDIYNKKGLNGYYTGLPLSL